MAQEEFIDVTKEDLIALYKNNSKTGVYTEDLGRRIAISLLLEDKSFKDIANELDMNKQNCLRFFKKYIGF